MLCSMIHGQSLDSDGRLHLVDKFGIKYIYIKAIYFRDITGEYVNDCNTGEPICLVSNRFNPQWLPSSNTFISINEDLEFLIRR